MITVLMLIGLALATPRMSEREIHLKYFKQVYGENFEKLNDLKFWYGSRYYAQMEAQPKKTNLSRDERLEFMMKRVKSYWPTAKQIEAVCKMKSGSTETSKEYIFCKQELAHPDFAKDFSPIYESPHPQARLVGFFNREKGVMHYKGEYVDLRPYKIPDPEGTIDDSGVRPILTPILDYKIIVENGIEREWMRLPTMGLSGEAWVGTTDLEGPLPILDLQRSDKLPKRYSASNRDLGLVQLSETRILGDSCYVGVDKGDVLFKQFLFPMNWNKSLRTNSPLNYRLINFEGSNLGVDETFVKGPLIAEYFEKYKTYPPLVFRLALVDFFMGLGKQFLDETQVALSPGESDRNCDYSPEFFYKKIPKDTIVKFADRFGGVLQYGESPVFKHSSHEYQTTPFDDKNSAINKAMRGEDLNSPFSLYIHQIYKGD